MRNVFVLFFTTFTLSALAQFDHEPVFVDLEGAALRNALVDEFKTSTVLDYGDARDTFFRNIDAVDNVLECVYTGYKITLDPNLDPTEDAFAKDINTEHTYPRSKGAFENSNAFSDMHHLFPTRAGVNFDRGSLPFQEVVDNQADKWYFEDNVFTSVPNQNIDAYSELLENIGFEPREQHKGDVARAYFYFYTMYQNQADFSDPDFFALQQETLCQWHFDDPVDEKEWIRNEKIAEYQEDKKNPFILDCRLARLYCDEIMGSCLTVSSEDLSIPQLNLYPNPTEEYLVVELSLIDADRYAIYSVDGGLHSNGWLEKERGHVQLPTRELEVGFYVIRVYDQKGNLVGINKFVKI
ncbi:MAG: endonuclease [Bacteroidota bacterium]